MRPERHVQSIKSITASFACTFALLCVIVAPALAEEAKDDAGELAFNGSCGTCHVLRRGDNRLGPTLHGVIGRKSGSVENYGGYSTSMKSANITWDELTLDQFIENPESVVPGNNMKPYAGNSAAEARKKIVTFLKACNQCGPECPAPKKCTPSE